MPEPLQQRNLNTLTVHDREPQVFELSTATYNVIQAADPLRFELTLRCDTLPIDGIYEHPNLEVTIVTDSMPQLLCGAVWRDQHGYIEREHIWNVTGYSEWTPETFEDFTVIVRERRDTELLCEVSGHIVLNRQELPETPVTVLGWFRHDPETKRSMW